MGAELISAIRSAATIRLSSLYAWAASGLGLLAVLADSWNQSLWTVSCRAQVLFVSNCSEVRSVETWIAEPDRSRAVAAAAVILGCCCVGTMAKQPDGLSRAYCSFWVAYCAFVATDHTRVPTLLVTAAMIGAFAGTGTWPYSRTRRSLSVIVYLFVSLLTLPIGLISWLVESQHDEATPIATGAQAPGAGGVPGQ